MSLFPLLILLASLQTEKKCWGSVLKSFTPHTFFCSLPIPKIAQVARATVIFLSTFFSIESHTFLALVSCTEISVLQKPEICRDHFIRIWNIWNVIAESYICWWKNKRDTEPLFNGYDFAHLASACSTWTTLLQQQWSSVEVLLNVCKEKRRIIMLRAVFSPFCKAIFDWYTSLCYLDYAFCLLF